MKKYGEEIYDIIPNRYPMMILYSLEIMNDMAVSEIHLDENDWFFACHYPGKPVLPLSLLLESMTQTFSSIFLNKCSEEKEQIIPLITSVSEIRLKDSAEPGDIIRLEASLNLFRRGIAKGLCRAYKNNSPEPILQIEITEVIPSQMVKIK